MPTPSSSDTSTAVGDLTLHIDVADDGRLQSITVNGEPMTGVARASSAGEPVSDDAIERLLAAVRELWHHAIEHLPLVMIALAVVIATAIAAGITRRLVRRMLARTRLRPSLRELTSQLSDVGVWLIGLLIAALIVFPGFSFAQVVATAGLASIALGFAFKDVVENFFAGVLILWRSPFQPGDYIELPGQHIEGYVHDVWIRLTLLRQPTDELIVVPNAKLYKDEVRVLTWKDKRRTGLIVGIAYGEDVDQSREVIRRAVRACASVSKEHDVEVFACEFADSSLNFEVAWWTGSRPLDVRRSRDEVVGAIKRALDEAKIEIPFPYRTLVFKGNVPVAAIDRPAGAPMSTRPPGPAPR